MKLITAIIKPIKFEDVRQALHEIGVRGVTATEVKDFGYQKGHTEHYRGAEYAVDFLPKVKLEVTADEGLAERIIKAITTTVNFGKISDGRIFVHRLDEAIRIRASESTSAL